MPLLIRKIDRGKWRLPDNCSVDDIPADAVTCCLRTRGNVLSAWEVASNAAADVSEAVLAIVSAGQHLETIDVVIVDPEHLSRNGVSIVPTPGRTPVAGLASAHRNLASLSYKTLGVIAGEIMEEIGRERTRRFTIARLKELLEQAIRGGRLSATSLEEGLRNKLQCELQE